MIRCNLLCVGEATIIPRGFRNYGARCTDRSVLRRLAGSPSLTLLRNLTGGEPQKVAGVGAMWGICHPQTFSPEKILFCKKFYYLKIWKYGKFFVYCKSFINYLYE
jgi:hypothetical protein|nr:MAG TPA: hypothetical protein [Crassvirales sp.]